MGSEGSQTVDETSKITELFMVKYNILWMPDEQSAIAFTTLRNSYTLMATKKNRMLNTN